MKSKLLALALVPITGFSAITINFSGVGFLDAAGNALSDGALIQIIASTADASFSDPTPLSFVSGDDVVLASFALNSETAGVAGGTIAALSIPDYTTIPGLSLNDPLMVRWFPSLAVDSAAPGATTYGSYRTQDALDGSDIGWLAPADAGGTWTLNLIGVDFGGSVSNAALTASLTTGEVIPEPSSFAAFAGLAVLGAVATRRRRSA